MTNVLPFSASGSSAAVDRSGLDFLSTPDQHGHAVQFYETEDFLFETVGRFLQAGLEAGDAMVVIATPEHRKGFTRRLNAAEVESAVAEGRPALLDAGETLARFMVGEMPDPDLFHDAIGSIIGRTKDARPRLRAYGEMVDLLWREGNSRAAIRLEELWNDAGKRHSFSLLCAYTMGNFYKEGDSARFMEICRNHDYVIPTEQFTRLDDAHARLREIGLLQQRARSLEHEITHRKELEEALRDALRDRARMEEELRACVRREKEARAQAEASDSFKEMFLGILGHDLRNPLNTMLTTARMMERTGSAAGSKERLARIVASGIRMERMISQVLDLTRARLADGIPVDKSRPHDLSALAAKIVGELRVAYPDRAIDLRSEGPCVAQLDPDRLEQVISNLVGNAVTHGDRARPITVTVFKRGNLAGLAVHNHGQPIPAALLPDLFSPFKRWAGQNHSAGLGLGLYIVERIVGAHGGKITVDSSESGTRFEVVVPVLPNG